MAGFTGFGGGVLLGLASSLHCIGMCGGVALMLGSVDVQQSPKAMMGRQLMLHGGRMLSYVALGALVGSFGSLALGGVDAAAGHMLLRWAAALSLGWIGLSMAGLMPSPAVIGHAVLPNVSLQSLPLHVPKPLRGLAAGLAWGLLPCGMVYGALLYALFAGSVWGGALVMFGFALGTVPALLAGRLGLEALRRSGFLRMGERGFGFALCLVAVLSLVDSGPAFQRLCGSIGRQLFF